MIEEWKNLTEEGLEFYQISNFGNARSIDRVVPTRIVNHGKEMIVNAKRKGKDLSVQYDGGRATIRLQKLDGTKCRRSVPLLVMMYFGEPCPGDISKYTAEYKDGNTTNNRVDNLYWLSKAHRASEIGKLTKGEYKEHFQKYHNLVFYVHGIPVAFYRNTTDVVNSMNEMGFSTSEGPLVRFLKEGNMSGTFFYLFEIKEVSDEEYREIELNYSIMNLKSLYDIIMLDRNGKHRVVTKKEKVYVEKEKVKKQVVYKDKIVYRDKIVKVPEKQIVEKIVYVDRQTGEKVRKPRTMNKSVSVSKINENQVEKKVQKVEKVQSSQVSKVKTTPKKTQPKKTSKSMFSNPNWERDYYDDYVDIDTLDMMEPELDEIEEIERELYKPKQVVNDRDRFKEEMMKRLGL